MVFETDSLIDKLALTLSCSPGRFVVVTRGEILVTDQAPGKISSSPYEPSLVAFSRGVPWVSEACSQRWLGTRWLCFPGGIPGERRLAMVSSRIRQRLDHETWWFDLLRTLTLQCDPAAETLLVAKTTTAFEAACRAAQLFGRPVIRFDVFAGSFPSAETAVRSWLKTCLCSDAMPSRQQHNLNTTDVAVSPELDLRDGSDESAVGSLMAHIPVSDRLLFVSASRTHVLACRPHGHVFELIGHHLRDQELRDHPLVIAGDAAGQMPACVSELPTGWIAWLLERWNSHAPADSVSPLTEDREQAAQITSKNRERRGTVKDSCPLSDPESWLLHWTRARTGPWPGESTEDFLDTMILQSEWADRSALATLLRIISGRTLLASSEGIRGRHLVVAFTAVPLSEFRARRVFRKHRHRFDFEPWGVAVEKSAIIALGAEPVIYGQDEDWQKLEPSRRPHFQKATKGGATCNSEEREWRTTGDVDLCRIPRDSVHIFVENAKAADLVSRHCDWDVIIVPGSREKLG